MAYRPDKALRSILTDLYNISLAVDKASLTDIGDRMRRCVSLGREELNRLEQGQQAVDASFQINAETVSSLGVKLQEYLLGRLGAEVDQLVHRRKKVLEATAALYYEAAAHPLSGSRRQQQTRAAREYGVAGGICEGIDALKALLREVEGWPATLPTLDITKEENPNGEQG